MYRVDVLSVTNVCTVHFPKRIVQNRATLIFIKDESELQRFVLDCEMTFLITMYLIVGMNTPLIIRE